MRVLRALLVFSLAALTAAGCEPTAYRAKFYSDAAGTKEDRDAQFLKCHTRDGRVYVLKQWSFSETQVTGEGLLYDVQRNLVSEGPQTVALSDVALFETNRAETVPRSPAGYVVLGLV